MCRPHIQILNKKWILHLCHLDKYNSNGKIYQQLSSSLGVYIFFCPAAQEPLLHLDSVTKSRREQEHRGKGAHFGWWTSEPKHQGDSFEQINHFVLHWRHINMTQEYNQTAEELLYCGFFAVREVKCNCRSP